jgi:hypothetical protein
VGHAKTNRIRKAGLYDPVSVECLGGEMAGIKLRESDHSWLFLPPQCRTCPIIRGSIMPSAFYIEGVLQTNGSSGTEILD